MSARLAAVRSLLKLDGSFQRFQDPNINPEMNGRALTIRHTRTGLPIYRNSLMKKLQTAEVDSARVGPPAPVAGRTYRRLRVPGSPAAYTYGLPSTNSGQLFFQLRCVCVCTLRLSHSRICFGSFKTASMAACLSMFHFLILLPHRREKETLMSLSGP